ncbi:hypothetical protein MD484_g1570, partial [Candolleomyces efflorescens]
MYLRFEKNFEMAEPYLITGFDEVHPRLEIHELHKNTEQFTLFIFALIEIQKRDYMPNAASFQELSGIHGRPYERWSGDPNVPKNDGPKGWGGYCTHKSVLFPSWHRPVILAMEQSINAAAVKLADEWTKPPHVLESVRQSWKTAARQLRFPFWDWTDPRVKTEGIPNILRPQELKLSIPGVISKQVVDNPLAGYFFASGPVAGAENKQDPDTKKDRGFHKEWLRTCRRPSNSAIMPSEDYVTMNTLLSEGLSSRQIEVGRLFCYLAPDDIAKNQQPLIWDEFSNTDPIDPKKTGWPRQNLGNLFVAGSIELPHNSMHNTIGGWGAMGDTDYAAFDPIFYLHHCNMDRILAFWEHTYNKYWLGDGYRKKDGDGTLLHFKQLGGTWSQDEKVIITQSSPLQPFRTASGEYWTPSHARFLKDANSKYKFGYTYPDIVQTINGEDKTVSLNDPLPDSNEEVNRCKEVLQRHFGFPEPRPGKVDLGDDKDLTYANYRRFHLAVELVEHAFGGSYSLELVFRGKVVASFDVFARADSTQCAACRAGRAEGGFIRGVLDIPN